MGPLNQDQQTALLSHNRIRALVNSSPLTWSPELTHQAQIWANYLAHLDVGHSRAFLHPRGADEGENIIIFHLPNDEPLTHMTRIGFREKRYWHGGLITKTCEERCRHGMYTQIVWHDTTHVGMASARATNGKIYAVARYWPVGNIRGREPVRQEAIKPEESQSSVLQT